MRKQTLRGQPGENQRQEKHRAEKTEKHMLMRADTLEQPGERIQRCRKRRAENREN
jgi:hypothetical protein